MIQWTSSVHDGKQKDDPLDDSVPLWQSSQPHTGDRNCETCDEVVGGLSETSGDICRTIATASIGGDPLDTFVCYVYYWKQFTVRGACCLGF